MLYFFSPLLNFLLLFSPFSSCEFSTSQKSQLRNKLYAFPYNIFFPHKKGRYKIFNSSKIHGSFSCQIVVKVPALDTTELEIIKKNIGNTFLNQGHVSWFYADCELFSKQKRSCYVYFKLVEIFLSVLPTGTESQNLQQGNQEISRKNYSRNSSFAILDYLSLTLYLESFFNLV